MSGPVLGEPEAERLTRRRPIELEHNTMSITPRSLSRRSMSLDVLSPSPSWTGLQFDLDPTACIQVGTIPFILHPGVEDLQCSIHKASKQDDSHSADSLNLPFKNIPTTDYDTIGAKSTELGIFYEPSEQSLVSAGSDSKGKT